MSDLSREKRVHICTLLYPLPLPKQRASVTERVGYTPWHCRSTSCLLGHVKNGLPSSTGGNIFQWHESFHPGPPINNLKLQFAGSTRKGQCQSTCIKYSWVTGHILQLPSYKSHISSMKGSFVSSADPYIQLLQRPPLFNGQLNFPQGG